MAVDVPPLDYRELPPLSPMPIRRFAAALKNAGVHRGDRVAFLLHDGFTLAAGLVVLFAAVSATRESRAREFAVMRAVGAGRALLLACLVIRWAAAHSATGSRRRVVAFPSARYSA